MSLFKKFANFCRNSNERADDRGRSYNSQWTSNTHWESCRTCLYSSADGLYCMKYSRTISFYDKDNSKCKQYVWDEDKY